MGEMVHGTTLVTNAVIEGRGARLGLLTTQGFRDMLEIGIEQRYDIYDLFLSFPDPLVPRRRRLEVGERLDCDGARDGAARSRRGARRGAPAGRRRASRRSRCASCTPTPIRRTSRRRARCIVRELPEPVRLAVVRSGRRDPRIRARAHDLRQCLRAAADGPLSRPTASASCAARGLRAAPCA